MISLGISLLMRLKSGRKEEEDKGEFGT